MANTESLKGKKILITSYGYEFFGGAELNAVELADQLVRFGMKPTFFSYSVGDPLKTYIENRFKTKILTDQVNNLAENDNEMGVTQLNIEDYDYIWVGGNTVPISILRQINTAKIIPKFIFIHMSPLIGFPLDAPLLQDFEVKIASKILSVGERTTRDAIYRMLGKNVPLDYWRNPAPVEFRRIKERTGKLRRIAVISSSHPSDEIIKIKEIIEGNGITIDYIGKFNSNVQIVDAEFYNRYDLIIGIGKNAKYSLTSGVPIYIYGRFGGPGYLSGGDDLNPLDIDFSGRGGSKKYPHQIAEEIIAGYADALQFHNDNREKFIQNFSLDVIAGRLFSELEDDKSERVTFSDREINWAVSMQVLFMQRLKGAAWLRQANGDLEVLRFKYKELEDETTLQKADIRELTKDIRQLYASRSWKITKPFRLIGGVIKKVKTHIKIRRYK